MAKRRRFWLYAALWVGAPAALLPAVGIWPVPAAEQAPADDTPSPREMDVWGRFGAGSWKQTRITSETLDAAGKVVSTTVSQVRTTLTHVDSHRITLRITVTMDSAGRHFDTEPQTVEHGYYGEDTGQTVHVKEVGKTTLKIDGGEYPCQCRETSIESGGTKTVTKLSQSSAQPPYLLRRETHGVDPANPANEHEETAEVIAMDMPLRVVDEIKPVAVERCVQKTAKGTTTTLDMTSVDVPGGIASRTSKEMDAQGHVIRRVSMELIDFHAVEEDQVPEGQRRRLFHRRRNR